jgi:multimeric flavodoxin WrbA
MKVLGLVGSPRKKGNTDLLVDKILEGASIMGHSIEKFYLYDMNLSPCVDCRGCKKGDLQCVVDDGMQILYPKLIDADVIIFGTPLYWYGPTGMMKIMMDRLRPFVLSKKLKGKKAIVVVPSQEGPSVCSPVVGMFELTFKCLGIDFIDKLLVIAYEKGEVANQPDTLKKAFKLGKSLKR